MAEKVWANFWAWVIAGCKSCNAAFDVNGL